MTTLAIGYIGLLILVIVLFTGIHIGIVMTMIGFFGMVVLSGWDAGLGVMRTVPYTTFADYGLSVIPLFILMGTFCFYAGISQDLYDTVHAWLGHFRGGLSMATVAACAMFAAVSGSSLATAATMGTVALPEMKRFKYSPALATGCVAAGGTLGILIPPSVGLILYGVITEQSIGALFLAGFIPGILQALFYIGAITIMCMFNPILGPKGPSTSFKEKLISLKGTWIVLLLFLIVIGGLYAGIFSPTEAAGIGACGAFIFALARKKLTRETFGNSLIETVKTTAMIFVIITGAMVLGYFLAATRLPFELATYIGNLAVSRYVILVFVLIIFIALGCVMDSLAILLLTVPIFYPLIVNLGFDPIWFGILVVRATEIGLITPPVGMNVYIIKGVARDVPMFTIFKGIIPFLVADILHVALLIAIPEISTFLPYLLK